MSNAIYNPHNKPESELPTIYGFNNGGQQGFYHAQLLAEDGTPLGSHLCSEEGYMLGDLGIIPGYRLDRHAHFKKHYPDGYKMEFISYKDAKHHEGLQKAIKLNHKIDDEDSGQDVKIEIEVSK